MATRKKTMGALLEGLEGMGLEGVPFKCKIGPGGNLTDCEKVRKNAAVRGSKNSVFIVATAKGSRPTQSGKQSAQTGKLTSCAKSCKGLAPGRFKPCMSECLGSSATSGQRKDIRNRNVKLAAKFAMSRMMRKGGGGGKSPAIACAKACKGKKGAAWTSCRAACLGKRSLTA